MFLQTSLSDGNGCKALQSGPLRLWLRVNDPGTKHRVPEQILPDGVKHVYQPTVNSIVFAHRLAVQPVTKITKASPMNETARMYTTDFLLICISSKLFLVLTTLARSIFNKWTGRTSQQ